MKKTLCVSIFITVYIFFYESKIRMVPPQKQTQQNLLTESLTLR